VFESSGSRVSRYEHNMGRVMGLPSQSVALLATLMLRGPQTGSELRANSERLYRFADQSSVEGFLDELMTRADDKGGPLVVKLPRAPGTREARWVHRLCGDAPMPSDEEAVAVGELAALRAQQRTMQAQIDELQVLVERLYEELGVARNG
jgi:uncharacterized protein